MGNLEKGERGHLSRNEKKLALLKNLRASEKLEKKTGTGKKKKGGLHHCNCEKSEKKPGSFSGKKGARVLSSETGTRPEERKKKPRGSGRPKKARAKKTRSDSFKTGGKKTKKPVTSRPSAGKST